VSKVRIVDRFTQLAEQNLEKGREFETIWQVYTLRGMRTACKSTRLSELVEHFRGSTLPLLLLDMKNSGLFNRKLPIGTWERQISKESILTESSWLLAYEGYRNGWLVDKSRAMGGPFFRTLADRNVVFYDRTKNVKRSSSIKRLRAQRQKSVFADLRRALLLLRGFKDLPGSFS
jgi:hypothetical protein